MSCVYLATGWEKLAKKVKFLTLWGTGEEEKTPDTTPKDQPWQGPSSPMAVREWPGEGAKGLSPLGTPSPCSKGTRMGAQWAPHSTARGRGLRPAPCWIHGQHHHGQFWVWKQVAAATGPSQPLLCTGAGTSPMLHRSRACSCKSWWGGATGAQPLSLCPEGACFRPLLAHTRAKPGPLRGWVESANMVLSLFLSFY